MQTTRVVDDPKTPKLFRKKVRLQVTQGPDCGKECDIGEDEANIGTLPVNDLVLTDPAVSRCHLRITPRPSGYVVTDLDSTNGSRIAGLRLGEVQVDTPVDIHIGETVVRLTPLLDETEVPLHHEGRFGELIGQSAGMRAIFAKLPMIAKTDATVLIEGETGTGKEVLAEEIHRNSSRKNKPFIVVDCGSLPHNLVESELFGHVRGSFTGAIGDRAGAFELADGGTVFLDEIGEMAALAQPRLLRVLDTQTVKRVGSDKYRSVDVRIIAATNRDLRVAVNEGTFRADLYYRLSVVRMRLPPLRERKEDIEALAHHFLNLFAKTTTPPSAPVTLNPDTLQRLIAHRWPGNVRELRNFMNRVALMTQANSLIDPLGTLDLTSQLGTSQEEQTNKEILDLPYKEAKTRWLDEFEITYIRALLEQNKGNVAAAARQAGVDRTYLFRLIRRYGLRDIDGSDT